jgi:hypothetical protein
MLTEALIALAAAGGTTLVEAAATDSWATAKAGAARLLGRGRPEQTAVIEARLENGRAQLAELSGPQLDAAQSRQVLAWTTRLEDLLEEEPGAADGLRQLLSDLAAAGVPGTASFGDHGVLVGGHVTNVASSGGVAAAAIHGEVSTAGNPPPPDQALA